MINDILVKSWTCKLCEATFLNKDIAVRHVGKCDLNPKTRSCGTCQYYSTEERSDGLYNHVCGADSGRKDTWLQNCNDWAPVRSF